MTESGAEFSNLYLTLFGAGFGIFAVSMLFFGRYTVARIERQLQEKGHSRPSPWDGVGLRLFWYASVMALPAGLMSRAHQPFIDVELVRAHAGPMDRILGWVVELSGLFTTIVLVWGMF